MVWGLALEPLEEEVAGLAAITNGQRLCREALVLASERWYSAFPGNPLSVYSFVQKQIFLEPLLCA